MREGLPDGAALRRVEEADGAPGGLLVEHRDGVVGEADLRTEERERAQKGVEVGTSLCKKAVPSRSQLWNPMSEALESGGDAAAGTCVHHSPQGLTISRLSSSVLRPWNLGLHS